MGKGIPLVGGLFGGSGGTKIISPPPLPAPVAPPPTPTDPAVSYAGSVNRRRAGAAAARTILSSPQGLSGSGSGAKKTLLGQ